MNERYKQVRKKMGKRPRIDEGFLRSYSRQPEELSARGSSEDSGGVSAHGNRTPADSFALCQNRYRFVKTKLSANQHCHLCNGYRTWCSDYQGLEI